MPVGILLRKELNPAKLKELPVKFKISERDQNLKNFKLSKEMELGKIPIPGDPKPLPKTLLANAEKIVKNLNRPLRLQKANSETQVAELRTAESPIESPIEGPTEGPVKITDGGNVTEVKEPVEVSETENSSVAFCRFLSSYNLENLIPWFNSLGLALKDVLSDREPHRSPDGTGETLSQPTMNAEKSLNELDNFRKIYLLIEKLHYSYKLFYLFTISILSLAGLAKLSGLSDLSHLFKIILSNIKRTEEPDLKDLINQDFIYQLEKLLIQLKNVA